MAAAALAAARAAASSSMAAVGPGCWPVRALAQQASKARRGSARAPQRAAPVAKPAEPKPKGRSLELVRLPHGTPAAAAALQKPFNSLALQPELQTALRDELGLTTTTPIQALGIPVLLRGRNALLAAETGSGKTLAYLLPLIQRLREEEAKGLVQRKIARPRAAVLAPSRELCAQVVSVIKKLSHHAPIRAVAITGAERRAAADQRTDREALDSFVDIVVGTPARLLSHRDDGHMSFSDMRYLVADEADTLFDTGFGPELRQLILSVKSHGTPELPTQLVAVTATLPKAVDRMVVELFDTVERVTSPALHRTVPGLRQRFVQISGHHGPKHVQLLSIIKDTPARRTMIFCNTVGAATALEHFLRERKLPVTCLHSDVSTTDRLERLEAFRSGKAAYLVCTDMASRGLDTIEVDHVILFDFPTNAVDYLHRVGRTARASKAGRATSLIARKDRALAAAIQRAIKMGSVLGWKPEAGTATATPSGQRGKAPPSRSARALQRARRGRAAKAAGGTRKRRDAHAARRKQREAEDRPPGWTVPRA